jgi:3-methylfumaryl-CoA hydratase
MEEQDQEPVVRSEVCGLSTVRRVAAMLDQDPDHYSDGDVLPRGWQFILLGADTRRSALRGDGFPGLGVPIPDLGLPRLMLGGRTVSFHDDIVIGDQLRRESRVHKLARKETATGSIAIVTLEHSLFRTQQSKPALTEAQTYILMGAPAGATKAAPAIEEVAEISKIVTPDETLLFQYSALGFNSHKIHLDRNFAREVEGFPDLVVNGGLATLLLTEFARNELGVTLGSLTAKHMAPLFCGHPISIRAQQSDGTWRLRALDESGRLALAIDARQD